MARVLEFPAAKGIYRTEVAREGAVAVIIETPIETRRSVERIAALAGERPESILARYARVLNHDVYDRQNAGADPDFGVRLDDAGRILDASRDPQCRGCIRRHVFHNLP